MERISILVADEMISADTIRSVLDLQIDEPTETGLENAGRITSLEYMEKKMIEKTLAQYDGHRQKTAHALGIGVRTLGMKIKRWNLTPAQSSSR